MIYKLVKTISVVIILTLGFLLGKYILNSSLYFNSPLFDGAFQSFNPLFRLSHGQFFGSNHFFNFHGIGVVLLTYPLFILFGKTLFASELSRNIVSASCFFIAVFSFTKAFIKPKAQILIAFFIIMLFSCSEAYIFKEFILPDVSSKGTRAFIGLMIVPVLIWLLRSNFYQKYKNNFVLEVITGFLCGFNIFYSTDTGLASWGAMLVTLFFFFDSKKTFLEKIKGIVVFSFISAATFLFFAFLGCGLSINGLIDYIKYVFVFQPSDQMWYFGAPPNIFIPYIFSNNPLSKYYLTEMLFRFLTAFFLTAYFVFGYYFNNKYKICSIFTKNEYSVLIYSLLFGVVSCISLLGIFAFSYTNLLWVINLLVITILLFRIISNFKINTNKSQLFVLFAIIVFVVYKLLFAFAVVELFSENLIPKKFSATKFSGVYLSKKTEPTYEMFKKYFSKETLKTKNLWSTYASLQSPMFGEVTPTLDYIIFALGPEFREKYAAEFKELAPEYVTTLNPHHTMYERWLVNQNWNFYQILYKNYEIIDSSITHLVWRRKNIHSFGDSSTVKSEKIVQYKNYFVINAPSQKNKVMEVTLNYSVKNKLSWLPLFGKMSRYLIYENNNVGKAISLPPYYNQITFPIFTQNKNSIKIYYTIAPNIFADIKFNDYKVKYIELDSKTYKKATDFTSITVNYN